MAILPRFPSGVSVTPPVESASAAAPLRRCTFRRVTVTANARALPVHEFACTFPDRKRAVPLGNLEDARPICASCTYQGIFRADSD